MSKKSLKQLDINPLISFSIITFTKKNKNSLAKENMSSSGKNKMAKKDTYSRFR